MGKGTEPSAQESAPHLQRSCSGDMGMSVKHLKTATSCDF